MLDFLPLEPHKLLHTLEYSFLPAMRVFPPQTDGRTLGSMCPNLKKLKVAVGEHFRSAWFATLPSTLSILHLDFTWSLGDRVVYLNSADICALPRSLTELELGHQRIFAKQEEMIWPPNLLKLVCTATSTAALLKSLPHTLTHLCCEVATSHEKVPFSSLPPELESFELKVKRPTFILDAPLPPRMRVFAADSPLFFTVDQQYITAKQVDVLELKLKFPYFFPRTLEHLDSPCVPPKLLAKYCPALRNLGPSSELFLALPNWSFKGATAVLEEFNDQENPKWQKHRASHAKKALFSGRPVKEEKELESVNGFRLMNIRSINIRSRLHIHSGQAHFLWGGMVNGMTLQSYSGPMSPQISELICSAHVALRRLTIIQDWTYGPMSVQFVKYLGRSLIELSCGTNNLPILNTTEFREKKPLRDFNSSFETLTLNFYPLWTAEEVEEFWTDLPLPPSSTAISLSVRGYSRIHTHFSVTKADWSGFPRLQTLHLQTYEEPTTENLRYNGNPDLNSPMTAKTILEDQDFVSPGVTFKGFASLPSSITNLKCFIPTQISVDGIKALPRNLITGCFVFVDGKTDNTWTSEHWDAFPKQIVSLTLIGATLGAKASNLASRLLQVNNSTIKSRAITLAKLYETFSGNIPQPVTQSTS